MNWAYIETGSLNVWQGNATLEKVISYLFCLPDCKQIFLPIFGEHFPCCSLTHCVSQASLKLTMTLLLQFPSVDPENLAGSFLGIGIDFSGTLSIQSNPADIELYSESWFQMSTSLTN